MIILNLNASQDQPSKAAGLPEAYQGYVPFGSKYQERQQSTVALSH